MGARNPDLICPPPDPMRAATVAEMRAERWTITAYCPTCRTRMHVDLDALKKLVGDDFVMWGARSRCKVWVRWNLDRRCEGRVIFLAQSSEKGASVELKMTDSIRQSIDWRRQAAEQGLGDGLPGTSLQAPR